MKSGFESCNVLKVSAISLLTSLDRFFEISNN